MKLRKIRLKYFEHVKKMGEERQVKKTINAKMLRRMPAGRLRKRWKVVIRKHLEGSELSRGKLPQKFWTENNEGNSCRRYESTIPQEAKLK